MPVPFGPLSWSAEENIVIAELLATDTDLTVSGVWKPAKFNSNVLNEFVGYLDLTSNAKTMALDPRITEAWELLPEYLGAHVVLSLSALGLGLALSLPLPSNTDPKTAILDAIHRVTDTPPLNSDVDRVRQHLEDVGWFPAGR